jgi:hypothetical protein
LKYSCVGSCVRMELVPSVLETISVYIIRGCYGGRYGGTERDVGGAYKASSVVRQFQEWKLSKDLCSVDFMNKFVESLVLTEYVCPWLSWQLPTLG